MSPPTVTEEIVVLPDDIVRASNLLGDIFQLTVEYYGAEAANPELSGSPPSAFDELRRRTLLREMMIGPPAYTHHSASCTSEATRSARHTSAHI